MAQELKRRLLYRLAFFARGRRRAAAVVAQRLALSAEAAARMAKYQPLQRFIRRQAVQANQRRALTVPEVVCAVVAVAAVLGKPLVALGQRMAVTAVAPRQLLIHPRTRLVAALPVVQREVTAQTAAHRMILNSAAMAAAAGHPRLPVRLGMVATAAPPVAVAAAVAQERASRPALVALAVVASPAS